MECDPNTLQWIAGIGQPLAVAIAAVAVLFAARSARAARRSADTAEANLAAQTRPMLVDVPRGLYYEREMPIVLPTGEPRKVPISGEVLINADEGWLSVPLRNVGPGLARIFEVELWLPGSEVLAYPALSVARPPNVPPGEETRIGLLVRPDEPQHPALVQALRARQPVEFTVRYRDFAGSADQDVVVYVAPDTATLAWTVSVFPQTPD